ncbi:hypothetical protein F543_7290 [Bibersteinia trehalosi USDA-ARS-USMARC-189]|uniref:Uncharacterized protein n=1 Tax=Bibersteinia trehalosi USDA-ARS-USMARC-189 TaxID=1263831 RepID=A0ABM5PB46_BIBTR|nr:hypothetical protein WQG_15950 [Bibersteinia trehalosi USDA-ARS-USMARC-192]AHG83594.1 hypothetical protein F543_7290 [Bibersteinia trehalosi USDA-ARS-USMARC-189]
MHKSSRDFYLIKRYDYTFFKRSFLQKILQNNPLAAHCKNVGRKLLIC